MPNIDVHFDYNVTIAHDFQSASGAKVTAIHNDGVIDAKSEDGTEHTTVPHASNAQPDIKTTTHPYWFSKSKTETLAKLQSNDGKTVAIVTAD